MTITDAERDALRATIYRTRNELATTTTALVAKADVKARIKDAAATAASHMLGSTTGATRRLVRAVTPRPSGRGSIATRAGRTGRRAFDRVKAALPTRGARSSARSGTKRAIGSDSGSPR